MPLIAVVSSNVDSKLAKQCEVRIWFHMLFARKKLTFANHKKYIKLKTQKFVLQIVYFITESEKVQLARQGELKLFKRNMKCLRKSQFKNKTLFIA